MSYGSTAPKSCWTHLLHLNLFKAVFHTVDGLNATLLYWYQTILQNPGLHSIYSSFTTSAHGKSSMVKVRGGLRLWLKWLNINCQVSWTKVITCPTCISLRPQMNRLSDCQTVSETSSTLHLTITPTSCHDLPGVRRFELLFQALLFHSSHYDYFCHFFCEQLSVTPWLSSRRECLKGCSVV